MSDIIDRVLGAARKRLETEDGLTGEKLDEAVEVFKDELAQQLTKPREVQAPVSRENLRTATEINDASKERRSALRIGEMEQMVPIRGQISDIDDSSYLRRLGGYQDTVKQVMGDPLSVQKGDQRDFYGGIVDKQFAYDREGRNGVMAYLDRNQDLRQNENVMNMIGRLVGTAGLLFG
tara:strand:- start:671 stop:1204 length:534 start_codon:yes stop_codon:yes gene_type:complete